MIFTFIIIVGNQDGSLNVSFLLNYLFHVSVHHNYFGWTLITIYLFVWRGWFAAVFSFYEVRTCYFLEDTYQVKRILFFHSEAFLHGLLLWNLDGPKHIRGFLVFLKIVLWFFNDFGLENLVLLCETIIKGFRSGIPNNDISVGEL